MQRIPLTLLPAVLLFLACSVKEERTACPCRLTVDASAFPGGGADADILVSDAVVPQLIGSRNGPLWVADVSKELHSLSVVRGGPGLQCLWKEVRHPEGEEPDSTYAYALQADCDREQLRVLAEPWKQFCTVTLREKEQTAYRYAVQGGSAAFSRADLSALDFPFSFPLQRTPDGDFRFRLPRQRSDGRLCLVLSGPDGAPMELPLGEWMDRAGYDWTLPSLEDVSLLVDYTAAEVRVRVQEWDVGRIMTLSI